MSIKDLFSRTKDAAEEPITDSNKKVTCDTVKLKEFIADWCKNEGQDFDMFAVFLEFIGIKTPVKLSNCINAWPPLTFLCVDAEGSKYSIALGFGDLVDCCSTVYVIEEKDTETVTTSYDIFMKYEDESERKISSQSVQLNGKTIVRNKISITWHYSRYSWGSTVNTGNGNKLNIYVSRPYHPDDIYAEGWIPKNLDKIEKYLFEYDYNNFSVDDVYETLKELMGKEITDLSIEYKKASANRRKERALASVCLSAGKITQYGYVTPKEESYNVTNDGNWEYSSPKCNLKYTKSSESISFCFEGNHEELSKLDLPNLLATVEKQIAKIKLKVNT